MNIAKVLPYYKIFLSGLKLTLIITVASVVIALLISIILNVMQSSKHKAFVWFVKAYVLLVRSTPLLLLLFICHFGSAVLLAIKPNPMITGTIGLAISASAYMTESIRGGFSGVDKGQKEAAYSLGVNEFHIFLYITFPQAIKKVLPALLNDGVLLIKSSSLLGQIGVSELFLSSQKVSKASYAVFESYAVCGVIFYILILLIGLVINNVERRMKKSD